MLSHSWQQGGPLGSRTGDIGKQYLIIVIKDNKANSSLQLINYGRELKNIYLKKKKLMLDNH